MYDELIKNLRGRSQFLLPHYGEETSYDSDLMKQAANAMEELTGFVQEAERDRDEYRERLDKANDAIEELQATLCNWCAVCPYDKRDLSTCEIYESCRAKPPKEE